ncbi:MAG: hypothetical protein MOGMAGMI_02488 [Candidatus Omnitrophica bacterium]|nr:hypothetical protein [Candidatus Omnitrophota bacterium]
MAIEVTVDALLLTDGGWHLRRSVDGWQVDAWCQLTPYADGEPVTGQELAQLALLGLRTRPEGVIQYAGAEAPSSAQVGTDILTWVGTTHAAAAVAWVGKRATAFVAAED